MYNTHAWTFWVIEDYLLLRAADGSKRTNYFSAAFWCAVRTLYNCLVFYELQDIGEEFHFLDWFRSQPRLYKKKEPSSSSILAS